ncbi:MAG TPA: hypothetical protein VD962_08070 [Rubricoccaceae bacterium]|nr:hypothetical protein [Rubricoccaceae bacterium]
MDRTPVTGLYYDRESADRAYQSIRDRGYNDDDIHVLMSDETRKRHYGDHPEEGTAGSHALEGAGTGAAIGGTVGGILGALAAAGTNVVLPGLGLVIAGPLAGALAGAGAGGATGTLLGALVGAGIPEEHAKQYEEGVNNGGMVVGVTPRNDEDATYFSGEFGRYGAGRSLTEERGTTPTDDANLDRTATFGDGGTAEATASPAGTFHDEGGTDTYGSAGSTMTDGSHASGGVGNTPGGEEFGRSKSGW